jgi:hypothetical protein
LLNVCWSFSERRLQNLRNLFKKTQDTKANDTTGYMFYLSNEQGEIWLCDLRRLPKKKSYYEDVTFIVGMLVGTYISFTLGKVLLEWNQLQIPSGQNL